jgi:hypothetical protein
MRQPCQNSFLLTVTGTFTTLLLMRPYHSSISQNFDMLLIIAVVAGFDDPEILGYTDLIFNKNAAFENLTIPICSG